MNKNIGEKLAHRYPKNSRTAFVILSILDILATVGGKQRISYSHYVDSFYVEHHRMERRAKKHLYFREEKDLSQEELVEFYGPEQAKKLRP